MKLPILFAVIAGLCLTACTGPKPTSMDAEMEAARVNAKVSCVQAKAEARTSKYQAINTITDAKDKLIAMAFDSMEMQAAHFSPKDECATGMSFNEARTAIAKSQNELLGTVAAPVASGATIYGVVNSMSKATTKLAERAGNQTSTTITGDGNSTNHEHVQTTSIVSNDIKVDGDGSNPVVNNPSVTGPDQSSHEETTNNGVIPEGMTPAGGEAAPVATQVGGK